MNPDAKEFVPAHILKRRQEEKEAKEAENTLNDVTDKLDKVNLKASDEKQENDSSTSCRVSSTDKTNENSREVQVDSTQSLSDSSIDNLKPNSADHSSSTSKIQNGHSTHENHDHARQYGVSNSNNNQFEGDYPEELQDLNGEDDRFLLKAGENICEFNGEQFIVPGDDDFEPPHDASQAGYDFGNAEDNEDADVCNAFEEFLGNLPAER